MKIIRLITLFLLLLVTGAGNILAHSYYNGDGTVPQDPTIRVGRLPNGLTYYIKHNDWPEHRADFYIAQRVGSINEEENQRGLAHFLEHMCFNGTTHFPGNSLIRYLETLGVKFGENLNAYTSVDETVYNIDNVPTARVSALDSCLLILRDWSHDLTLSPKEIDKERGVIQGEWRMRTGAQYRMLERCAPALFPQSRYGQRLPIGLMSVVQHFKYKELRDYYQRWYRPDNQAVIVVGDVDVDRTEQKIKEMFSSVKMPPHPAKRIYYPVPDNPSIICVVEKDKEQAQTSVQLIYKHAAEPDDNKDTEGYLVRQFLTDAASSMLNDRLDELQKNPEVPFTIASTNDGDYLLAKTKKAFTFVAGCESGKAEASLKALTHEAMRAYDFGFTATEFDRYRRNYLSSLESDYRQRDKEESSSYVDACVQNFLNNEPMPSTEQYYKLMNRLLPTLTADDVNRQYRSMVSRTDTNVVIVAFCPDKEGESIPSTDGLVKAFRQARADKLTAYDDHVKDEPLMTKQPVAGRIIKETTLPKWNAKVWTLSNGATVYLKKTDFEADQVYIEGEGWGGTSVFGTQDVPDVRLINQVMNITGVGNFTVEELKKKLAGLNVSAMTSIGDETASLFASSTPKDLETAFQLLYLNATAPKRDEEAFRSLIKVMATSLANVGVNPTHAFADSVYQTVYARHPLARMIDAEMVNAVNYDKVLQMFKQTFSNFAGFNFVIIGNYDEAAVRQLTEKYIASLPSTGTPGKAVDKGLHFVKGKVRNEFTRKMETPQAMEYVAWESDCPYTLENCVMADIIGQALQMTYLKQIREDKGWAYSLAMSGQVSAPDLGPGHPGTAMFSVRCPVKPENCGEALKIILSEMEAVAHKGVDASALAKIKEYLIKTAKDNATDNDYWRTILSKYAQYGVDFDTDYISTVRGITSDHLKAFAKKYITPANRAEVIMRPAADDK